MTPAFARLALVCCAVSLLTACPFSDEDDPLEAAAGASPAVSSNGDGGSSSGAGGSGDDGARNGGSGDQGDRDDDDGDDAPPTDDSPPAGAKTTELAFVDASGADVAGACFSDDTFGRHAFDGNEDGKLDFMTLDHQRRSSCFWRNSGGKLELSPTTQSSWYSAGIGANNKPCGWHNLWADVNGDGKVDSMGEGSEGGTCLFYNTTAAVGGQITFDNQRGMPGDDQPYPDFFIWDVDGDNDIDVSHQDHDVYDIASRRRVLEFPGDPDGRPYAPIDLDDDGWLDGMVLGGSSLAVDLRGGKPRATKKPSAFAGCGGKEFLMPLDFDRDGDVDYVCSSGKKDEFPAIRLIERTGRSSFSDVTASAGELMDSSDLDFKGGFGSCDLDNDGYPEIVHYNNYRHSRDNRRAGGALAIFHNQGGGRFVKLVAADLGLSAGDTGKSGGDCFDYDNDGFADLAIKADSSSGDFAMLRNVGEGGNWLKIHLRGPGANTDCIGCKVTVTAGGKRQASMVQPQTRGGNSLIDLHVGIGDADSAKIQVRYPSEQGGATFNGVSANQRVMIRYDAKSLIREYVPGVEGFE